MTKISKRLLVLLFGFALSAARATPPNIVIILADDLGYGDTGAYGAEKVQTPNIDRLARDGMLFTEAYATSPVCTPSRYGLLTGIYPWRVHRHDDATLWATHRVPLLFSSYGPAPEQTLAARLQAAGYTTGAVGKWHLGLMNKERNWNEPLRPGPLEAGFDYFFGDASNRYEFYIENDQVARTRPDETPITGFDETLSVPDSVWKIENEKNAAVLSSKAVEFIQKQARNEKPFFLYYCPNNVHTPLTPAAGFRGKSAAGLYGDFVQELDWAVGEIVRALEETGKLQNTLLIFTSDNGGKLDLDALAAGHRANRELLGQKTDIWEGGIRVPFIVHWPDSTPAGSRSDQLLSHVDLLPTLLHAAEHPVEVSPPLDGLDLLAVWRGDKPAPSTASRPIAANMGNRSQLFAVRQGPWLYINGQGSGGVSAGDNEFSRHRSMYHLYAETGMTNSDIAPDGSVKSDAPPEQLYNLESDAGQATNVIGKHPEKAEELRSLLEQLKRHVNQKKP